MLEEEKKYQQTLQDVNEYIKEQRALQEYYLLENRKIAQKMLERTKQVQSLTRKIYDSPYIQQDVKMERVANEIKQIKKANLKDVSQMKENEKQSEVHKNRADLLQQKVDNIEHLKLQHKEGSRDAQIFASRSRIELEQTKAQILAADMQKEEVKPKTLTREDINAKIQAQREAALSREQAQKAAEKANQKERTR